MANGGGGGGGANLVIQGGGRSRGGVAVQISRKLSLPRRTGKTLF